MISKDPIERLREELRACGCSPDDCVSCSIPRKVRSALDEIEAAYMKLPVDADGVPIKPGDKMQFRTDAPVRVDSIGNSRCYEGDFGWFGGNGGFYGKGTLSQCRHVKTDAIAEELAKFLSACGDDDPHYYDEEIAEFAERIRKVMHDGD